MRKLKYIMCADDTTLCVDATDVSSTEGTQAVIQVGFDT